MAGGIAITKQLGTADDLAFGVGEVSQERMGETIVLKEINGSLIPYSATLSINEKIQDLESGTGASQAFAWESEAWKRTSSSFATQPAGELVRLYTSNKDGTFTIEEITDTYSSLHWANSSSLYADDSQLKAWISEAKALTALSYATEVEDTEVNLITSDGDGTFTYTPQTGIYSALHWAAKAATFNPNDYYNKVTLDNGQLDNRYYTEDEVDALVLAANPVGAITEYEGTTAPAGFLVMDNSEVSETTYAALFAIVGTKYNTFDGAAAPSGGNFRLPPQESADGRGLYTRGVGSVNGAVGSYQQDVFKEHDHAMNIASRSVYNTSAGGVGTYVLPDNIDTSSTGDAIETRPITVTKLYCIKY